MPAGRKPKAKEPTRELTPAETLAALLVNIPADRQKELVDGILDKACGMRLFSEGEKRPGSTEAGGSGRSATVTFSDGEVLDGWFYTSPPDPQMAKLLLEHGVGRPAVRESVKTETAIYLVHRVPGRRNRAKGADQSAPEPVDVRAAEMEAGTIGIGAAFPPEPEDEIAGEDDGE